MYSNKLFVFIFSFFLAACSTPLLDSQKITQLGTIIDLKNNQEISVSELISRLSHQDYILIGEEHDQKVHHQLEQYILEQIDHARPLDSVVFEMLNVSQQQSITQTQSQLKNAKSISESEIKQSIQWTKWDWNMYKDLIINRLKSPNKVIAANLTQSEVNTILNGAEPLKGNRSISQEVQDKIAQLMHSVSHANLSDINKMIMVQQFRDRRMAEKLFKTSQKPTALIAGNHHVRKDIGVPIHLADYGINNNISVLMIMSQQENITSTEADYIWLIK
ncbi:ChaN family lipoprotein [Mannheimia massilioguelmaensis]|uniref:ChaN family lipoprotein n=1 Tax=Mannheimia massilioguelmaensis TaxID=1604354 RepID=UPI0005CAAE76|nr:ChaN family lipoprotein [Mannheimia massilioguelmaensis]